GVPQGDEGGVHPGGQNFQDPPGISLPGRLQDLGVPGHGEGETFDAGPVQVAAHDVQGQAVAVFGGAGGKEVGDAREHLHRLQGDQIRITRSHADPVKSPDLPGHASVSSRAIMAMALITAAATAEPPLGPRAVMKGQSWRLKASLDSAALTQPTGSPTTRAGAGAPAANSSRRRNRAVGALPMATIPPASRGRAASMAAAARVVPWRRASRATSGSSIRQNGVTPSRLKRPPETPASNIRVSVASGPPWRRAATPAAMAPGCSRTLRR